MRTVRMLLPSAVLFALGFPFMVVSQVLAVDAGITQIEDFMHSVINAGVAIAGLLAAGFFVIGGFGYITSSGDPERLHHAKHTLVSAAIGLVIVIAAFVISNIVADLATSAFGK